MKEILLMGDFEPDVCYNNILAGEQYASVKYLTHKCRATRHRLAARTAALVYYTYKVKRGIGIDKVIDIINIANQELQDVQQSWHDQREKNIRDEIRGEIVRGKYL